MRTAIILAKYQTPLSCHHTDTRVSDKQSDQYSVADDVRHSTMLDTCTTLFKTFKGAKFLLCTL